MCKASGCPSIWIPASHLFTDSHREDLTLYPPVTWKSSIQKNPKFSGKQEQPRKIRYGRLFCVRPPGGAFASPSRSCASPGPEIPSIKAQSHNRVPGDSFSFWNPLSLQDHKEPRIIWEPLGLRWNPHYERQILLSCKAVLGFVFGFCCFGPNDSQGFLLTLS